VTFPAFGKIPRWNREIVITEKIDGTNGVVAIVDSDDDYEILAMGSPVPSAVVDGFNVYAGSRSRWISPGKSLDNFGFAGWVQENADELVRLGSGLHYGEWYGSGIQRGYGLRPGDRRWMLFNTGRWSDPEVRPKACEVSTVLWHGPGNEITHGLHYAMLTLQMRGSQHVHGFMNAEGVVMYHRAGNAVFKATLENDDSPKSA
jgi:RNA ligase